MFTFWDSREADHNQSKTIDITISEHHNSNWISIAPGSTSIDLCAASKALEAEDFGITIYDEFVAEFCFSHFEDGELIRAIGVKLDNITNKEILARDHGNPEQWEPIDGKCKPFALFDLACKYHEFPFDVKTRKEVPVTVSLRIFKPKTNRLLRWIKAALKLGLSESAC